MMIATTSFGRIHGTCDLQTMRQMSNEMLAQHILLERKENRISWAVGMLALVIMIALGWYLSPMLLEHLSSTPEPVFELAQQAVTAKTKAPALVVSQDDQVTVPFILTGHAQTATTTTTSSTTSDRHQSGLEYVNVPTDLMPLPLSSRRIGRFTPERRAEILVQIKAARKIQRREFLKQHPEFARIEAEFIRMHPQFKNAAHNPTTQQAAREALTAEHPEMIVYSQAVSQNPLMQKYGSLTADLRGIKVKASEAFRQVRDRMAH